MEKQKAFDKLIDGIFSIKKTTFYLIMILLLGFILRILTALRTKFSADEMVHGTHAIGFIGSKKLQIMDQSAVWFWLTDFFMKIFGVNVLGIRFMSVLFGSLAIVLIYLIGKEIFSEKVGLIAALLSAISPYQLDMMEAGMDMAMTFFVLFSIYFFVLSVKREEIKYFYLIWVAIGIAVMIKPIALLFLFPLILSSFYYHFYKKKSIKLRTYIYVGILLLIMFLPVLTFNYLLYKDKEIVDLQFARFTRISIETYQGIAPTIESFKPEILIFTTGDFEHPGLIIAFLFLYRPESLIALLFALIGLFYLFKYRNRFTFLLLITFLIPFIFLAGTSLLPNHFIFTSFYAMLLSAYGINKTSTFIKKQNYKKIFIYITIILIVITSSLNVAGADSNGLFGQKDAMGVLIDFKEENINENALVITDGRIYRGRTVFMLWDRNYLEGSIFLELSSNIDQVPGEVVPVDIYFIECISDDCGWGTIKDQPEFNQSMELLTSAFSDQFPTVKTINDVHGEPHFRIYRGTTNLKSGVSDIARTTHEWFYYPVNYEPNSEIFDNYETSNPFDALLDWVAHLILYIEVLIALLFGISVFYFLIKRK